MNEAKSDALTDKIGMWVFLGTELLFLSSLFTAFFIYRHDVPGAFHQGTLHMNLKAGSWNTALLLTSSLCVALTEQLYKNKKFKSALTFLMMAIVLGGLFLFIKSIEYYQHYKENLMPGLAFDINLPLKNGTRMYFILYYLLTGLHALHLMIGLGVLMFIGRKVYLRVYDTGTPGGLEIGALYWHFVDLIWVFLFPLFYLVDRQ